LVGHDYLLFSSYLTLNNIATLKPLKDIETGAIRKLWYGYLFAFYSSGLTMAVSLAGCEISSIKE